MSPEMTKDSVSSLLQAKQFARSLENFVDALIAMVENEDTLKALNEVRENAAKASGVLQRIYNRNAREAFGIEPAERRAKVVSDDELRRTTKIE